MGLIILVILITLVVSLFVGAGILVWTTKLFKIEKPRYKKSLIVLVISGITSFIAGIIFGIIKLGFLSNVLASITTFFVFHYFYKKYYQNSWKKSLGIYIIFGIIFIIVSLLVVIPTRLYIVEPFTASGETMSPTYNNGDYLLINKLSKDFVRGDVVVFKYKEQPKTFFIKRIIALPSEKVEIKDGRVYINDQILNEGYYSGETMGYTSITLGQDQYFVLGDNRNKSFDSRNFGPVAKPSIEGKIFYKVSGLVK